MPWIKNRPLYVVLRIQFITTIIVAGVFLVFFDDLHSAISAMLGGVISVTSSAAFAIIVSNKSNYTASDTIRIALRAEAIKIVLIVSLLWAVFNFYVNVNALVFVGTFVLIVLVHSMALLVTDDTK